MLLRNIKVGDMIEFRDDAIFQKYKPCSESMWVNSSEKGLYLYKENISFGIVVQMDEIMTEIYWIDGKWEKFHTFDLNTAINVEIV